MQREPLHPLEPPVRAYSTLIPRVTTLTHKFISFFPKEKLDALLALEAQLLAVQRLDETVSQLTSSVGILLSRSIQILPCRSIQI